MKRIAVALVVASLTLFSAQAATRGSHPELLQNIKTIDSAQQLQEWLSFYYLHPRPDLAVTAFKTMNDNGLFAREDLTAGIVSFLGEFLRKNPNIGPQLVPEVRTKEARMVLAQAAWLSGSDTATDVLDALGKGAADEEKSALKEMTYRKPPEIIARPIKTEWDIDALWGSFFASGDSLYVERITSTLGWTANSDPVVASIGNTARRTLARNAVDHPRVLQICEQQLAHSTGAQKDALAAVIAEARQQGNH